MGFAIYSNLLLVEDATIPPLHTSSRICICNFALQQIGTVLFGRAWASPTLIMTTSPCYGECLYVYFYVSGMHLLPQCSREHAYSINNTRHMCTIDGSSHCYNEGFFEHELTPEICQKRSPPRNEEKHGKLLAHLFKQWTWTLVYCVDRVALQSEIEYDWKADDTRVH